MEPEQSKGRPRIGVCLTRDEFDRFRRLARQLNTSVSALGQLAIRNTLVEWETGRKPSPKADRFEGENHLADLLDEADAYPEPEPPREFKDHKGGIARMQEGLPEIRIAVTPEEFGRLTRYARHLGRSAGAVGQLAVRNILGQAEAGAVPILPVALTAAGALPTPAEWQDEEDAYQARMNMHQAHIQLIDIELAILGHKP